MPFLNRLGAKPRLVLERQFPRAWIGSADSHLITLHRRGSGLVLRVDCARWGQTPEDLRQLAVSAPHARTRERALALFDITQHRCASQVAMRTGRRVHTVLGWVHAYNQGGPDALAFRRTGGRRPLFARSAKPNSARRSAPPRTLRRLVGWVRERFGLRCCRETIRAALHRRKLSWKKAKKLLGRADPERRQAFVERLQGVLDGAQRDRHLLVYMDEAHIHQDADLGYGWAERGQRFWVNSSSPGLSARISFYGLYLYNEGQVRLWPSPRANGDHTIAVLQRLRAAFPDAALIVLWDGVYRPQ